jgi:hypothetical protein
MVRALPLHDVSAGAWGGGSDLVWRAFGELSSDRRRGFIEVASIVRGSATGVLQPMRQHDAV